MGGRCEFGQRGEGGELASEEEYKYRWEVRAFAKAGGMRLGLTAYAV